MTWQELRTLYPDRWVLVEALEATTQRGHRTISLLQLVGDYDNNWYQAWAQYKTLHHTDRQREYYVLHTSNETLDIGVIDAFGRIMRQQ
jgi:hypothetical protein